MIGEHRGGKGIEGNVGKEKVREGKVWKRMVLQFQDKISIRKIKWEIAVWMLVGKSYARKKNVI